MVTKEDLEGLDLLLWHGNGPKAANLLHCNQSTVSRRVQRCLGTFGLRVKRLQGEWSVLGPPLLLQMEREIHQLARLLGQDPLRLEVFSGYSSLLVQSPPPGWILGPRDAISVSRPLALLRERVVDVWLTDAADDLPDNLDFPVVVWPLARQPVFLSGAAQHPLAGERNVQLSDLLRFPLPIVAKGFPRTHDICADLGLGSLEVACRRYDSQSWEGRTADAVTLAYTTPLHAQAFPGLVPLDSAPLFWNRIALVCRKEISEHSRVQDLHGLLRSRLHHLHRHHPHLEKIHLLL